MKIKNISKLSLAVIVCGCSLEGQALLQATEYVPYKNIRVTLHHAPYKDVSFQMLTAIVAGKAGTPVTYTGPGDVITSNPAAFWALRAYTSATRGNPLAYVCDAGDAHCIEMLSDLITGAAVIPTSNPDCTSSGCTAKILHDLTGLTLCGGPCDLTQSTEADRYTLTVNALNGHPVLTSSSATTFMVSPVLGSTVTQPYSATVVTERTGGFTSFNVVARSITGSPDLGFSNSTNTFYIFAGGTVSATAADSTFHAVQALYNGASSSLVIDGSATSGNVSTDSLSSGNAFYLGNTSVALVGATAEVGWWSADKSANFAGLKANQSSYYGTP